MQETTAFPQKTGKTPGSTERTRFIYENCRWKHMVRGEYVRPEVRIGIERLRYYTEAHRATAGGPEIIRRAMIIAGYSAKFISLPKNAQDAIIARAEQQFFRICSYHYRLLFAPFGLPLHCNIKRGTECLTNNQTF